MSRKKPTRHQVVSHSRKGRHVRSYFRGSGQKEVSAPVSIPKYYKDYPELNGWKFLTGDINWEEYGAKWYKMFNKNEKWADVLELVNMRDAVDEHYPQKYMVTIHTVSWDDPKRLKSGLETVGLEHEKRPSLGMKIDAMSAYGGDLVEDTYGNNAKELVESAMERN